MMQLPSVSEVLFSTCKVEVDENLRLYSQTYGGRGSQGSQIHSKVHIESREQNVLLQQAQNFQHRDSAQRKPSTQQVQQYNILQCAPPNKTMVPQYENNIDQPRTFFVPQSSEIEQLKQLAHVQQLQLAQQHHQLTQLSRRRLTEPSISPIKRQFEQSSFGYLQPIDDKVYKSVEGYRHQTSPVHKVPGFKQETSPVLAVPHTMPSRMEMSDLVPSQMNTHHMTPPHMVPHHMAPSHMVPHHMDPSHMVPHMVPPHMVPHMVPPHMVPHMVPPHMVPTHMMPLLPMHGTSLDYRIAHQDDQPVKRRNVKNRTKTGCLTCRKRRIKCDEAKPGCENCRKSKKLCLGYESSPRNKRDNSLDLPREEKYAVYSLWEQGVTKMSTIYCIDDNIVR